MAREKITEAENKHTNRFFTTAPSTPISRVSDVSLGLQAPKASHAAGRDLEYKARRSNAALLLAASAFVTNDASPVIDDSFKRVLRPRS